jgi:hypothetical protein
MLYEAESNAFQHWELCFSVAILILTHPPDSSLALQAVDEALFQTDCYNISFLKTAVCIIS